MKTDCTPAWMTSSCPDDTTIAMAIASTTTTAICHGAGAEHGDDEVADEHADRHADGHLDDAPQPLAVGQAEAEDRRDRREERGGVAEHLARDEPRDEHADADLHEEHPPGAQPAQPALDLGAQVVEVHGATVRSTRSAPSHGRAPA